MQGTSAGIDWASEEHALCVVDAAGGKLAGELFAHDEAGLRELIARMRTLGVERVAIERPDGLLVDRLLEAGFTVLPVHPNALKATRPRYEAAGGKSDGFDAFCLAELARTDSHRLRALRPDSDETKALRALTRTREDLVAARVRLGNELRAQLDAFWPGAARVFFDVDSAIARLRGALPLARRRTRARSEEARRLSRPPPLLGAPPRRRAARSAALGAGRKGWRARGRGAQRSGARLGRRA